MKRAFITTLSIALMIAGSLVLGTSKAQAQNPAVNAGKTAEQVFKNIQVLKGTPADELQPAMQFISSSLGVECSFCHVQGAFDKDDKKPKQTARKMIEMQMAINKEHFDGEREITCNSCHHGAEHPAGTPIIAEVVAQNTDIPIGGEPNLPSAEDVVNKYIQAVGGADAIKKITSRVQKGTISFGQSQATAEVVSKAPNKRISTVITQNGPNITAYDGHAGWMSGGNRPAHDMTTQENQAISFDATFYLPLELPKMFHQLRVVPGEKIGRIEVYQVLGTNPDQPPVRMFFDKVSGLLIRTVRYEESPLGRNPTQVDYSEYRENNGIKLPFQWTVARPRGRFTVQIADIQQNVPIDDSKFEKPAAAPATEQKPAEQKPQPK